MSQYTTNQSIAEFDLLNVSLDGHTLIEANAGTGKTYTISRIFLLFLLEKKIPASSILVVTFTEAATVELKERIHELLRTCRDVFEKKTSNDSFFKMLLERIDHSTAIDQLTLALHTFDNVAIYTIHGFCRTVLTNNPFECGMSFQSEIITNQSDLVREITLDFWRKRIHDESDGFIAHLISTGYNPLKLIELWNIASRSISDIKIIPDPQSISTESYESQFKKALKDVIEEWRLSRDEISKQLNSGSLKANIYKSTTIAEMMKSMDSLTNDDPITLSGTLFDNFDKFSTSKLNSSVKKGSTPLTHLFFTLCDSLLNASYELNSLYNNNLLSLQSSFIKFMRSELIKRKSNNGQLYFDDLLLKTDLALQNDVNNQLINTLRARYHAALIDEFQDTDELQYRIFSKIFAKSISPLFLIGDPKQSIYRFRGADIFTYLKAIQQVDLKYTLSRNYRSTPPLIDAVNALFCRANHLFVNDVITCQPSKSGIDNETKSLKIKGIEQTSLRWLCIEPKPEITASQLMEYCANVTANEISGLIQAGIQNDAIIGNMKLSAHHIAVLVRTNREANLIHKALSLKEIPSVIECSGSVFATEEADELLRVLTAIAFPQRTDLIRSALLTSFFTINANDLDAYSKDMNSWEKVITKFLNYHDHWNGYGISYTIRQLMSDENLRARILSHQGGERKLTNIIHLSELLQKEEQRSRAVINALLDWYKEKVNNISDHIPDDEMLRLESDSDCVSIVTIHKCKGLQFPIVFCPFCWHSSDTVRNGTQGYIVHSQIDNLPVLVLGNEEMSQHRTEFDTEILAEEMRLLYVALTRAELCCYAFWCTHSTSCSSAAAYLLLSNGSENPPLVGLKEYMKQLTHNDIIQQLMDNFSHLSTIKFEQYSPSDDKKLSISANNTFSLICKTLNNPLPEPWKISSFSALSRNHSDTDLINDDPGKSVINQIATLNDQKQFENMCMFPRGEIAGLFLHTLLEKVDLSSLDSVLIPDLINDLLLQHNFDPLWNIGLIEHLHTIAEISLPPSGFKLKTAVPSDCIKELQFHFPLEELTPQSLKNVLFDENPDLFSPTLYTGEGLDFKRVFGYMKGFIDLLIKVDDKFYIIDWKSNYLGNSTEEYTQEIILREMISKHYILQYYIYTIAVNRFLTLRYKNYSYEKNFGGIYYLFLRGLKIGSNTGIFFDRPKLNLISKLDVLFSGSKELDDVLI